MQPETSHIIILGSSLGARLSAVLIARQGQKVLHLCPPGDPPLCWEYAPPLLVRFLDLLDARTCLRPARPQAILTEKTRLELHGVVDLRDQLQREFAGQSDAIFRFLNGLTQTAQKLTDLFWNLEGVPTSFGQRILFPARLLRQGLSGARLKRSVAEVTASQLDTEVNAWLETCISGHTMIPFAQLSYAELALAWTEVSSPQEISISAFNDLLVNRFRDAGGRYLQIEPDAVLELLPGAKPGIALSGQQFLAEQILIGAGLPSNLTHLASLSGGYERKFELKFWKGTPSQIFPERIVSSIGANNPLRIRLGSNQGFLSAVVSMPFSGQPAGAEQVLPRVEALFPFCKLQLADQYPGCQSPHPSGFPGRRQDFQLSDKHYWNVSGASVFPTLLNTGECLAGMSLAARLAS
jgi:hypothetical protein